MRAVESRRSMRARRLVSLLAAGALLAGCRTGADADSRVPAAPAAERHNLPSQTGKPYVVMLSFDGFRHDYLDLWHLPAIASLARDGARAEVLVPTFPSKTFPNHYSIATGLYPGHHGLVGNEMWDPRWKARFRTARDADTRDARWYRGEPIWVTAEKQGMLAAAYFWPGSEAPIEGVRPTYFKPYDVAVPDSSRVDGVLGWLALPPARRPHLVLAYISDVDDQAHHHDPAGPVVRTAAETVDRALARLRAGIARLPIADSVTVVVVSDHGLAPVRAENTEYLDEYAPLADTAAAVTAGTYAQLFFGGDAAKADRAWRQLRRMPHARVWKRGDIPERLHLRGEPRAGDVLVLMDAGYLVERHRAPPASGNDPVFGAHGYDPAEPDMGGVFFAAGPAVRPGSRLGAVENVNVYPFVAHALGLRPAAGIDGRLDVMRPILTR
jgi:predicted AlkP superfamily pyrophosphatase or phosphodiesterase